MGRSFLARAKHGHMQCQFRAARSTLLSKGLQSQETKKLASTAQAHSSTIVPLLGNKLLFHSFATNQRASSLWPTASKHYNICIYYYIFIYLYTRVLVSGCCCRSPHSNSRCVESASEPTGCDAPGTNWHNASKQVVRVTCIEHFRGIFSIPTEQERLAGSGSMCMTGSESGQPTTVNLVLTSCHNQV